MFPVTVTVNNAAQLNAVMAALNVEQIIESVKPQPAAEGAKATKKEAKAEEKKQEAAPKVEAAATPPTAPAAAAPEQKAETSAPKYEDVAKSVLAVSSKHGRDAAIELLKKFGLETLKAAKPEQFADIKAAAEQAL